jgi:hypothetical protein
MKPGDLIEWVYKCNSKPVHESEQIWSTPMQCWIPVGIHPTILTSITDEFYVWLNPNGLFHARMDDTYARVGWKTGKERVVPRVVGEHR